MELYLPINCHPASGLRTQLIVLRSIAAVTLSAATFGAILVSEGRSGTVGACKTRALRWCRGARVAAIRYEGTVWNDDLGFARVWAAVPKDHRISPAIIAVDDFEAMIASREFYCHLSPFAIKGSRQSAIDPQRCRIHDAGSQRECVLPSCLDSQSAPPSGCPESRGLPTGDDRHALAGQGEVDVLYARAELVGQ